MVAVEIHERLGRAVDSSYMLNVPRETLLRLQDEFNNAAGMHQKFDLLREYGLLRQDVTWEHVKQQYETHSSEQKIVFDSLPGSVNNNSLLVNTNCDIICVGPAMLSLP